MGWYGMLWDVVRYGVAWYGTIACIHVYVVVNGIFALFSNAIAIRIFLLNLI